METGNPLGNLKLDKWYKVFIVGGFTLIIISLFLEVKGLSNIQLLLISSGFFFIGIGEWINHGKYFEYKPPNAYTGPAAIVNYSIRKPRLLGILLDLIGILLIFLFINSIFNFFQIDYLEIEIPN